MTDINLRHNRQGAWEWEFNGTTYGTDPNGNGIWRKLPKPDPRTVPLSQLAKLTKQPHEPITYTLEWEMIAYREDFHLPAEYGAALQQLLVSYG